MKEIWADIVGYEGFYQVSNMGNIRSFLDYCGNPSTNPQKILKPHINTSGYYVVTIYKNHKQKLVYIHRLVASAFLPNLDNKPQVNHKDGNKQNNIVSNLEWCTISENSLHAFKHNLRTNPMVGRFGSRNPKSKPVYQYALDGTFIKKWASRSEAANYYGCTNGSICACTKHRKKSCKGFRWEDSPISSF